MTVHSAVHRFQSLIGICSLHFERKCYYNVSIRSDSITSIKNKNLPWGCPEHATHSELQTFPTWTPPLHLHRHPRAKYLSALYLLLCNLKYRKYKQLSDMLRYIKYTVQSAEQCSENGDSGFMGHHPVSFGWWFTPLQRNVVPSSFKCSRSTSAWILKPWRLRRHTASAHQEPLTQRFRLPC